MTVTRENIEEVVYNYLESKHFWPIDQILADLKASSAGDLFDGRLFKNFGEKQVYEDVIQMVQAGLREIGAMDEEDLRDSDV